MVAVNYSAMQKATKTACMTYAMTDIQKRLCTAEVMALEPCKSSVSFVRCMRAFKSATALRVPYCVMACKDALLCDRFERRVGPSMLSGAQAEDAFRQLATQSCLFDTEKYRCKLQASCRSFRSRAACSAHQCWCTSDLDLHFIEA